MLVSGRGVPPAHFSMGVGSLLHIGLGRVSEGGVPSPTPRGPTNTFLGRQVYTHQEYYDETFSLVD